MISIIVPIYNVEKYLVQCINSLLNQTYRDLEIILVDDGSSDRCPEICNEYAEKEKRVKVIHQKNAGVSSARNAGLKTARGEFVGFVDSDDWVSPDMYGAMFRAQKSFQTDLIICGYDYFNEDGKIDEKRLYKKADAEFLNQQEVMKRMSDIPPSVRHFVCNKLFTRRLLQGIFFPEQFHSSEDVWFLTKYLLKIKSAVYVHEPLYCNRVRLGSATHGGLDIRSLADSYQAHEFMYQTIIKTYPALKDYSQAFLLDVYFLKYNEAKRKANANNTRKTADTADDLKRMRKAISREGIKALFNPCIYWKTRIRYIKKKKKKKRRIRANWISMLS